MAATLGCANDQSGGESVCLLMLTGNESGATRARTARTPLRFVSFNITELQRKRLPPWPP